MKIPTSFAPSADSGWRVRGETLFKDRPAELRKVAQTKIDVAAKQARVELDRDEADRLTRLYSGALTSAEARKVLGDIPTIATLMQVLPVKGLLQEARRSGRLTTEE